MLAVDWLGADDEYLVVLDATPSPLPAEEIVDRLRARSFDLGVVCPADRGGSTLYYCRRSKDFMMAATAVLRAGMHRRGSFDLTLLLNEYLARGLRVGICHVAANSSLTLTTPTLIEAANREEEGSEDRTARTHASRLDGG
jgi:hypothetical protein